MAKKSPTELTLGELRKSYPLVQKVELGWICGLLEGEGSFTFTPQPTISCGLHVRDLDVLLKLQKLVGGRLYGPYKNGILVQWKINKANMVQPLCALVYPYMSARRQKQIEALRAYIYGPNTVKDTHGKKVTNGVIFDGTKENISLSAENGVLEWICS